MLNLVEKVVAGFAGLCVLLTLGFYVFIGIRTTQPTALLPHVTSKKADAKTTKQPAAARSILF